MKSVVVSPARNASLRSRRPTSLSSRYSCALSSWSSGAAAPRFRAASREAHLLELHVDVELPRLAAHDDARHRAELRRERAAQVLDHERLRRQRLGARHVRSGGAHSRAGW
mgnify:CR=1 FL=1